MEVNIEVILRDGYKVRVDPEDWELLKDYAWYARLAPKTYYVVRYLVDTNTYQRMHHSILDANYVDHINGLGWDNRRENLRVVTHQQNMWNIRSVRGRSHYKGVHWDSNARKWRARIEVNGKKIHLGYFVVELDAAKAYNESAKKFFGEFAYLNIL